MSDQAGEWLDVTQAAAAYKVTEKTIRRRIHAGKLTARQVQGSNGPEWRIAAPASYTGGQAPAGSTLDNDHGQGMDSDQGVALIPLDQLERLLAPLAAERDRLAGELAAERERNRAEIAALQEARLLEARASAAEIGELRGRLAALQEATASTKASTKPHAATVRRRLRWPWQT